MSNNETTGTTLSKSALIERLEMLAEEWQRRAKDLRGQSSKILAEAGISKAMRDYSVIHYEDRAEELLHVLACVSTTGKKA